MNHKPISFHNVSLSFPQKTCFEGFTTQIHYGNRIALIGQNGSGKSTLLKMLQGFVEPSQGNMYVPEDIVFGHVSQVIEEFDSLSGGQRLNTALTKALALEPHVLLLDEPTNHLDLSNRRSLMRLLQNYRGTLILASHDVEFLRSGVDTLWHIENGKIHIFSGKYDDYRQEMRIKRASLEQALIHLERQKKEVHQALMKEQVRAKKSKLLGEKHIKERKWPTIVSDAKARHAAETTGRKKRAISHKKQDVIDKLAAHTVYFIQVRCDLKTMQEREILRGDRYPGLANAQLDSVGAHHIYDMTVDTTQTSAFECAREILRFISHQASPDGFKKMMTIFSQKA